MNTLYEKTLDVVSIDRLLDTEVTQKRIPRLTLSSIYRLVRRAYKALYY